MCVLSFFYYNLWLTCCSPHVRVLAVFSGKCSPSRFQKVFPHAKNDDKSEFFIEVLSSALVFSLTASFSLLSKPSRSIEKLKFFEKNRIPTSYRYSDKRFEFSSKFLPSLTRSMISNLRATTENLTEPGRTKTLKIGNPLSKEPRQRMLEMRKFKRTLELGNPPTNPSDGAPPTNPAPGEWILELGKSTFPVTVGSGE